MTCWKVGRFVQRIVSGMKPEKRMRSFVASARQAVKLAFYKGMSHREIAEATGAPLGTVKTRLELGLQKLTHAIKPLRHKI